MHALFIVPFASANPNSFEQVPQNGKLRYRARVAYDGTQYSGWQFQTQAPTIQAEVEKAVSRRVGAHVRVVGASRTDSGVHARGQGVHFDIPVANLKRCRDLEQFEFTINQMLPREIRMGKLGVAPLLPVPEDELQDEATTLVENSDGKKRMRPWHAIYCSKGKLYTYRLCTKTVPDPLQRLYRHHEWRALRGDFSEDHLRRAASRFVGTHDFSAFTNTTQPPPGIEPPVLKNPYRHIRSVDVISDGDGVYDIEFRINGALYRMIRNIMGTILDVACGKIELSQIDNFFESRDRRLVPKSAPAHGLCLEEVFYEDWSV